MTTQPAQISSEQEAKLRRVYAQLLSTRLTQNSTEIELLFFEVLSVCRNSIDVPYFFELLSKLRVVQNKEYLAVQNKNLTIKSKIVAIKRFKNAIRLAMCGTLKELKMS